MGFNRKDLISCVLTGLITGLVAWRIAVFLQIQPVFGVSFIWFLAAVPLCWILGVNLGYFLGRFMGFFNQFGRFVAIGFTNAAVDFGILYLLIAISGVSSGAYYSGFKTISFVMAAMHSYVWNKFWVFDSGASQQVGQEMTKFFAVTISAAIINVLTASIIVSYVGPQFGLSAEAWAGFGAAVGSATALAFSFVGFRMIVFRKH